MGYGNANVDTCIGMGEGAQEKREEKGAVYCGSVGEEK